MGPKSMSCFGKDRCNTDSEIQKNRLSICNSAVDKNSIKYTAIGCRNDKFERQSIKIKSLKIAIFPQGQKSFQTYGTIMHYTYYLKCHQQP